MWCMHCMRENAKSIKKFLMPMVIEHLQATVVAMISSKLCVSVN